MNNIESSKENPMIYYAIILLALGLVTYKWLAEVDKKIIIEGLIGLGIGVLLMLWCFAILFFSFRGFILDKKVSKIIAKILIHLTNIVIVALFVYRMLHPHVISTFLIIHGIIVLILFLYYNYNIPVSIHKLKDNYTYNKYINLREHNEIVNFIHADLNELNLDQLIIKRDNFKNKQYSKKVIESFKLEFKTQLLKLNYRIEKLSTESEILKINRDKDIVEKELEQIRKMKRLETMTEESEKISIRNNLTRNEENVIVKKGLRTIEKEVLLELGYKQVNEYCVYDQKIITVFVKPIMDHSSTHTFLVWSVKKLLEDQNINSIITHDTRDADITFKYDNKLYAIEIETGNLLKKKKILEEKVAYNNRKYSHRWFFIVSNRNLQSKYNKYGLTTQRTRVYKILEKMLQNKHPKKVGGKAKTATEKVLKESLK